MAQEMKRPTKLLLYNYATIREIVEETKAKMKEMVDGVKQSDRYKELETWLSINEQSMNELSLEIGELALVIFKDSGDKKPIPGVGIREMSRYDYDPVEAYGWAVQKAPMTVVHMVDKKKFEKVLSITEPSELPEYIKVWKEPIVTISNDLEFVKEFVFDDVVDEVDNEQP